jgi:hypothetical protein
MYTEFDNIVSLVDKRMFELAPIGKKMMNIKKLEKTSYDDVAISAIKSDILKSVQKEIIDII